MRVMFSTFTLLLVLSACSDGTESGNSGQTQSGASGKESISAEPTIDYEKLFKEPFYQEIELKPKWKDVEFLDATRSSYRLAVNYKKSASISGYSEISEDTKSVVRAALKILMEQGRNPREEWISVHVHARQPAGTGETGAALTRVLGRASYNFNRDQITFSPP